jgi:hypothetical protein
MRDWHLRQRGRSAVRGDSVGNCGSGMTRPCIGGSVTELSVTGNCHGPGGDRDSLHPSRAEKRSILLTLEKIRGHRFWNGDLGERTLAERLSAMDIAFCPAKSQSDGLSSPPMLRPFLWRCLETDRADGPDPVADLGWIFLVHVEEVNHGRLLGGDAGVIERHRHGAAEYLE